MESLQGSFNNHCFLGEHLNVECLEEGDAADFSYGQFLNKESLRFGEPFSNPIIFQDKMPFLQMLEGVESPSLSPLPDPNFHLLPRIQHQKKPWKQPRCLETDARIPPLELESCVSYLSESHSPIKSETKDQQYPHSSSCLETPSSPDNFKDGSGGVSGNSGSSSTRFWKQANAPQFTKPPPVQEKRKRKKRSRPSKNSEEVESQRMTHIAVERNRRKQMNDHLNALRSLMPPSFIQRGDQASIVGGAVDFVKELEQLLQSLQVQKRLRLVEEEGYSPDTPTSTAFNGFFISPQYTTYSAAAMRQQHQSEFKYPFNGFMEGGVSEFSAENKSAVADIEVTVIQTHVNLKILSRRRPGQLVKAIAALEELYLDILHLNVTSLESSVLYSFNLKIEEGCSLGSADEIAGAVYQIFNFINGN